MTRHKLELSFDLSLRGHHWPHLTIQVDGKKMLVNYNKFNARAYTFLTTDNSTSLIQIFIQGLDGHSQISLDRLCFFTISDPRFLWTGTYTPEYPEPWASQQINLPKSYQNFTVLGWNGTWTLEVTHPIFTWMHKKLDLGTIYP